MLSPILETRRLILRRFKETDIDDIYEMITDSKMTKYIRYPNITKQEELECIKTWIKEADECKKEKWVIETKDSNIVIGTISVNKIFEQHNYCNVGYSIKYDYWGNGFATEALVRVTEYLLNERGYYLVECSCNETNIRSSRVMIKAGFKKDGYIANRRLNQDGSYSGVEYYSKSKQD